jgi:2-deoxy-D-gluconate 3-dehydrogenase
LDGKVALVTGSSRGLGQGAALVLAEEGADIALLDRTHAHGTADKVQALGCRTHMIDLDLIAATPNEVEAAIQYTAGKRTEPHERPFDSTPVIDVDRGGKIT